MNQSTTKEILLRFRRRLALQLGYRGYCRTGAWHLMEELFRGQCRGVFFEAGAHDGWTGSNTYWLEASLGWRGVLVEPVPGLFRACCKERPQARVFHGALVSEKFSGDTVDVECSGLVSAVTASPMLEDTREIARQYYGAAARPTIAVPALTMNTCLERAGVSRLDFVSLDVEGFEAEALGGLDMDRWKPQWLLIECNDLESVTRALGPRYESFRACPPRDVLFKRSA
jgi:FkbM family methyltransferase